MYVVMNYLQGCLKQQKNKDCQTVRPWHENKKVGELSYFEHQITETDGLDGVGHKVGIWEQAD